MKTTDLFKNNRSSKKINESLQKTFGRKLNLENFDLEQLQDARNKLRTQVSQVRGESGFNENLENEAFTEAQWMLDAINAEIAEREEHIIDNSITTEEVDPNDVTELAQLLQQGEISYDEFLEKLERLEYTDQSMRSGEMGTIGGDTPAGHRAWDRDQRDWDQYDSEEDEYDDEETEESFGPMAARREKSLNSRIYDCYMDGMDAEEIGRFLHIEDTGMIQDVIDDIEANGGEPIGEVAPPGAKAERMVKHIKAGYAKDGKLTDKEKSIAYATAWKQHNKEKNESIESGENMTKLNEGEIQQAQSIVSAKTMVDRVGRWIEELSGMENDNLLQLGDQIRDEMGQEQAKSFISTVAPAIQQALENLKQTRETLSTGVRILTGEEQPAEMLGAEPASAEPEDEFGAAEPDTMNAAPEDELGAPPEDEFGAADAAAGGLEAAGRAKRESIDYGNRLMRVLAG